MSRFGLSEAESRWVRLLSTLNEAQQRWYVADKALDLCYVPRPLADDELVVAFSLARE